jgi:transketolase
MQGAYVLVDVVDRELVLIATGSEVSVAVEVQRMLALEDRRVRVVSAPCWEQFQAQLMPVQQAVLPDGVRRAAFEMGSTAVCRGIVGPGGLASRAGSVRTFSSGAAAAAKMEVLGRAGSSQAARAVLAHPVTVSRRGLQHLGRRLANPEPRDLLVGVQEMDWQ